MIYASIHIDIFISYQNPKEDCKFTKWLDKNLPEKANELINKYQDTVDSL